MVDDDNFVRQWFVEMLKPDWLGSRPDTANYIRNAGRGFTSISQVKPGSNALKNLAKATATASRNFRAALDVLLVDAWEEFDRMDGITDEHALQARRDTRQTMVQEIKDSAITGGSLVEIYEYEPQKSELTDEQRGIIKKANKLIEEHFKEPAKIMELVSAEDPRIQGALKIAIAIEGIRGGLLKAFDKKHEQFRRGELGAPKGFPAAPKTTPASGGRASLSFNIFAAGQPLAGMERDFAGVTVAKTDDGYRLTAKDKAQGRSLNRGLSRVDGVNIPTYKRAEGVLEITVTNEQVRSFLDNKIVRGPQGGEGLSGGFFG